MSDFQDRLLVEREEKQRKIEKLKTAFKTVITVKSNFPGEDKNHYIAYILVDYFKGYIDFKEDTYFELNVGVDGPSYIIGLNEESKHLKKTMVDIENTHPLGRFIDLDVFSKDHSLSRGYLRKCYLCDQPAMVCIRNNTHKTPELIDYIEQNVKRFFVDNTTEIIDEVIMLELDLDPKFGLVTPYSKGSHKDMNYNLMIKAKESITPFFKRMFIIGWSSKSLKEIFNEIRKIGLEAETAMLKSTNGVNAYKGLIFNLGVAVTAYAYCLYNRIPLNHIDSIIRKMTQSVIEDFNKESDTFGYFAFKNYNILGARGEVQKGIPNVLKAMEILKDFSAESRLRTLMFLIWNSEDTVLLKRAGNLDSYYHIKGLFKRAFYSNEPDIDELDQYCIDHQLSFGGSADLLIVAMFLKRIWTLFSYTT